MPAISVHWPMIARFTRRHPFLCIGVLIFPVAVLYGRYLYAPCDDMYIFLVYANNFVLGHGLTYNGAVVEGFTSPLWVSMLAILGLTGFPLPILAQVLSTLSGLALFFVTYLLTRQVTGSPWRAYTPVILLAAAGDIAFYMSVGLEQILFASLVTLTVLIGCYSEGHSRWLLPIIIVIMILVRPEGLLIAALVMLVQALRQHNLARSAWQGAVVLLMLLPFLALRWHIYGSLLPNTYYAKSGFGIDNLTKGIQYMLAARSRYGIPVLALVLSAGLSLKLARRSLIRVTPLLVIIAGWLVYVTAQGGDNMVGGRMYVPILPLFFTAIVASFPDLGGKAAVFLTTLALASALVLGYHYDQATLRAAAQWRRDFRIRYAAALYLREHFPPDTLVALNPAGVIPFYSQMSTIDMLGLNDYYIAHYGERQPSLRYGHQVGDGQYVLSREPDIILLGTSLSRLPGAFISDREIWSSSDFHALYAPVEWPQAGWAYIRVHPGNP